MQHPAPDPANIQERTMADAALHLSEIRYRRLFEAAHDGILILDPGTRKIVDANPFMTTLIGYPHEQLIGLELYQIGFHADAQESQDMFQKLKASGQVRYESLPLKSQQGGIRDVEVVANLYDEGGQPVVQCNVRDITERKRVELALRQHEERQAFLLKLSDTLGPLRDPIEVQTATMRLVVEHLDVMRASYFKIDPDQDGFSKTSSYDRGALPIPDHMRLSDFAPDMAEGYRKGRTSFIEDAETEAPTEVEREAYRAIGVRAGIGVPLVKEGLLLGILGVHSSTPRHWTVAEVQLIEDVADRVWTAVDRAQAETAFREREAELSRAHRIAGIGSFKVEVRDGNFVADRSPEYLAVHGLTPQDRGNSHEAWQRRVHPEDREKADRTFRECLADGRKLYESEYRIIRQNDGATRWMKVLAEIERDAFGAPLRVFGTHLDVTESRLHEVALSESASHQAFLLELSDRLRIADNATSAMSAAAELFARHCGFPLAQYLIIAPDGDHFDAVGRYSEGWLPAAVQASGRLSDHGPDWAPQFHNGESVFSDDHNDRSEEDANASQAIGIRSGSAIPLIRDGRLKALFTTASPEPRRWTMAEKTLQHEVAERTWAAVERARAEAALRESEAFSWAVFEASPDCVKIFDAAGNLLRMNINGQVCMEIDEFDSVRGLCWPVLWPQEEQAKVDAAMAEAMAGRIGRFTGLCPTRKGTAKWWDVSVTSIPGTDGGPRRLMASSRDVTERMRQEEHIRLLMGEVNHRSKNMLSLVQAIANRTVATHPKDFIERFGERVQALSASQDLLVKSEWKAVLLDELVSSQLAHFDDAFDSRITLDGPQLAIKASASQALGMALHELATNAAKYGALSNKSGRVIISWSLPSDAAGKARFTMSWIESGGPLVAKPTHLGFGSTVTDSMIKMSLGGDVEVDFAPTGLVWRIDCPAEDLLEGSVPPAPN